ncbi:hypothetical protein M0R45_020859 [Rubus argutus]|uniref:Uncharacterized protein n=1 Tax=Rubus argutus TaxID=59490 RepID=A0AAW1XD66_RUBAR
MVCSLGSGRMAVMARLLAGGSVSKSLAEEVPHQKIAAHLICRELIEANDANLLDEEVDGVQSSTNILQILPIYDMIWHVFDSEPMADTLLLVCCNACKKPVKASQYAAHSVLCRSLNSTMETNLELDGSMGQRKPPRKDRKEKLLMLLDGKIGMNSSCGMGAKGNSASVDTTYMMDGSGVSPENTSYSTSLPASSNKTVLNIMGAELCDLCERIAGEQLPLSDDQGITSFVSELRNCPAPLATKVYYSQRSNRLRTALCHLYSEAVSSNKELCTVMRDAESLPSIRTPDQMLTQISEVCLEKSIVSLPAGDLSNQFPVDNVLRPQAAGQSLGTMPQRNGRVPVV